MAVEDFKNLLGDIKHGRLVGPLARSTVTEDPKRIRVKDKTAIQKVRQHERCENPKCENKEKNPALHVHHIKHRGAGGDDVDENLVLLCWQCHNLAHSGQLKDLGLHAMVKARRKGKS